MVSSVDLPTFDSALTVNNFISSAKFRFTESTDDGHIKRLDVSQLTYRNKAYQKQLNDNVIRAMEILSRHRQLGKLAEIIDDPESGNGKVEYLLIILTRGVKTKAKFELLNTALLIISHGYKRQGYETIDMLTRYVW